MPMSDRGLPSGGRGESMKRNNGGGSAVRALEFTIPPWPHGSMSPRARGHDRLWRIRIMKRPLCVAECASDARFGLD
jgi:hypothetical protein